MKKYFDLDNYKSFLKIKLSSPVKFVGDILRNFNKTQGKYHNHLLQCGLLILKMIFVWCSLCFVDIPQEPPQRPTLEKMVVGSPQEPPQRPTLKKMVVGSPVFCVKFHDNITDTLFRR